MKLITITFAMSFAILSLSLGGALACQSGLTGRTLDPAEIRSFGHIQGLPSLPLRRGEYVITIDDGPLPATTPKIAAILHQACVNGTFFFIGRRVAAHPEMAVEVLEDGDTVGGHSFSHPDFGKLDATQQMDEVKLGMGALEKATQGKIAGEKPRYVRIPGAPGLPPTLTPELVGAVENNDWIVAGYDISPEDWRNSPAEESFARLKKRLGDRGVIVFHDGKPNTLLLIPMVLQELANRGAKVVSLP